MTGSLLQQDQEQGEKPNSPQQYPHTMIINIDETAAKLQSLLQQKRITRRQQRLSSRNAQDENAEQHHDQNDNERFADLHVLSACVTSWLYDTIFMDMCTCMNWALGKRRKMSAMMVSMSLLLTILMVWVTKILILDPIFLFHELPKTIP